MKTIIISAFFLCLTIVVKSQDTGNLSQDGKHVVYYQNGNVKAQGNYVNNKREGEWLFYYENGAIALKKNFSKGEQVGEWCYYNQDGGLLLKVDDISKINEKAEVALYENNKIKSKGTFVNGKKEGDFIINNKVEVKKSF
jgi:antitoxin component YwqK of YwqJK toxin-antitoxin module